MKINKKGFTLAELLIVVAVIAVLVAVAIPTFNNQLEKSRQATDLSNLRDAYATARLAEINGETPAVNIEGKAIKPIKIGAPVELVNMSEQARKNYSGIAYAFVYDPDSGLLYPLCSGYDDPVDVTSSDLTLTKSDFDDSFTYAKIDEGNNTKFAYVDCPNVATSSTAGIFASIPGQNIGTALKARSQQVRVETVNLPGGEKGAIQYGTPSPDVANDKFEAGRTALRLWGDTATDWGNVRIVVEFSYDKSTSSWTLKRVQYQEDGSTTYVTATGKFSTDADDDSEAIVLTGDNPTGVELGAIRFATIFHNGTTTSNVAPFFQPVNWNTYITSAAIS